MLLLLMVAEFALDLVLYQKEAILLGYGESNVGVLVFSSLWDR